LCNVHKIIPHFKENICTLLKNEFTFQLTPGVDSPIRNSGRYGDVNPGLTGLGELPTGEPSVIGSISKKSKRHTDMRFEVLTAVTMKITVFWDVRPCSLVQ
jgi:hypothetical protein